MNSWMKNDWQTALNASKKFANKCFYTAIKSDFLHNPLKYVQQVKGFIYYNPYWQKKMSVNSKRRAIFTSINTL